MFVHYYTHVPIPMSLVEARIDQVRTDIEHLGDVAYREGENLFANVGPGASAAKRVKLEIGIPEIHRAGLVYPVKWTATGAEALFPRLMADLTVSHLGPDRTKLSLEGTYEPPFGWIGRAVDRTLLKNVAESTVQSWVDAIAEAVMAGQPAG